MLPEALAHTNEGCATALRRARGGAPRGRCACGACTCGARTRWSAQIRAAAGSRVARSPDGLGRELLFGETRPERPLEINRPADLIAFFGDIEVPVDDPVDVEFDEDGDPISGMDLALSKLEKMGSLSKLSKLEKIARNNGLAEFFLKLSFNGQVKA